MTSLDASSSDRTFVVLYAAKSTADPHGSIPTQLADCRRVADQHGWQIEGEYSDEGFSAYHGNRGPDLDEAKRHAERIAQEHGSCILIAQHSDRFARGAGDAPGAADHLGEVLFWARRHGVELRTVQDDASFTNPLLAFAMGERNAEDSKRKAAAVKAGMRRRREKGLQLGGPPKLGYDYVRDEYGRTVPELPNRVDEAEAAIVRRIFSAYIAGTRQQELQRELNAEGLKSKRGGRWHQGTIAKVLADPTYAGWVKDKDGPLLDAQGQPVKGQWEAIVSEATWRQAEALRQAGRKSQGGSRGRQTNGRHLLVNGHLRCGTCGGAMVPRTLKRTIAGRAYVHDYYRCYSRIQNPDNCPQPPLKREIVDKALMAYFASVGVDLDATRERLASAITGRLADIRALREQAEREAMGIRQNLQKIEADYFADQLSAANFEKFQSKLTGDLDGAEAKVDRLAAQERSVAAGTAQDVEETVLRRLADLTAAVAGDVASSENVETVRAALSRMFESFTYSTRALTAADPLDERIGDRHMPVEISKVKRADQLVLGHQDGYVAFLKPQPRPEVVQLGIAGLEGIEAQPLDLSERNIDANSLQT